MNVTVSFDLVVHSYGTNETPYVKMKPFRDGRIGIKTHIADTTIEDKIKDRLMCLTRSQKDVTTINVNVVERSVARVTMTQVCRHFPYGFLFEHPRLGDVMITNAHDLKRFVQSEWSYGVNYKENLIDKSVENNCYHRIELRPSRDSSDATFLEEAKYEDPQFRVGPIPTPALIATTVSNPPTTEPREASKYFKSTSFAKFTFTGGKILKVNEKPFASYPEFVEHIFNISDMSMLLLDEVHTMAVRLYDFRVINVTPTWIGGDCGFLYIIDYDVHEKDPFLRKDQSHSFVTNLIDYEGKVYNSGDTTVVLSKAKCHISTTDPRDEKKTGPKKRKSDQISQQYSADDLMRVMNDIIQDDDSKRRKISEPANMADDDNDHNAAVEANVEMEDY